MTGNPFNTNLRIFLALLHRDLLVLKQKWRGMIIDSVVPLVAQVILFGKLFPLLGMPASFIAPLYLGSITGFSFFFGFSLGLRIVFDIQYTRFIDYHMSLPLPKRWLFAQYVTYFMIETAAVTLPLILLGIILLGKSFTIVVTSWPLFFVSYILMLLFFGTFFLALSFHYDFDWFRENLWPRRLTPLFTLSANFFVWKSIYAFSPWISYLFLLNPVTYLAEGLRATLIGGDAFISPSICIPMTCIFITLAVLLLCVGIHKRLDPV